MEKNPYVQREALRKVLSRLKKYRVLIALSILFAAVTVALTLYVPVLVGDTIDMIVGPGDVNFTGIASSLVQIAIIVCVTALLQWLMNTINNKITFQVVSDVRSEDAESSAGSYEKLLAHLSSLYTMERVTLGSIF